MTSSGICVVKAYWTLRPVHHRERHPPLMLPWKWVLLVVISFPFRCRLSIDMYMYRCQGKCMADEKNLGGALREALDLEARSELPDELRALLVETCRKLVLEQVEGDKGEQA